MVSNNLILENDININNDTDEKYIQIPTLQHTQATKTTSNNIIIYKDFDEDNYTNNAGDKYSKSYPKFNQIPSVQNLTTECAVLKSTSLLSSDSPIKKQENMQKDNELISQNNLDIPIGYTNCNNISMEITQAIPILMKSANSTLKTSKSSMIQNCENTRCHSTNNIPNISPSNLQSNIISKNIASGQTQDTGQAKDSGELKMILSSTTNNDMHYINDAPASMTAAILPKTYNKIISDSSNENIIKKSELRELREYQADKTELYKNIPIKMTKATSRKNKQEIVDIVAHKTSEKNSQKKKDMSKSICLNEKTRLLQKSMDLTQAVPVSLSQERTSNIIDFIQSIQKNTHGRSKIDETKLCNDSPMEMTKTCDKENIRRNDSTIRGNKTMVFDNVSMEMTKAMSSKNKQEITNIDACKWK